MPPAPRCAPCVAPTRPPPAPVVDLQARIEDVAWEIMDLAPASCCDVMTPRACRRSEVEFRIMWSVLDRHDTVESFSPLEEAAQRSVQLHQTEFRNDSDTQQKFRFQAERQTQSSVELSVLTGVSIGGTVNLSLTPGPQVAGAGSVGLGGTFSWRHEATEKDVQAETLKWTVDNEVVLDAGKHALAELSVEESRTLGVVKVRTDVYNRNSLGVLPVWAVDRKSGRVVGTVDLNAAAICQWGAPLGGCDPTEGGHALGGKAPLAWTQGPRFYWEMEEGGEWSKAPDWFFSYYTYARRRSVQYTRQAARVRLLEPEDDGCQGDSHHEGNNNKLNTVKEEMSSS